MAKQAEQLKLDGNLYFSKERFGAAIDAYTEAITFCPNEPIYWTNRALCHLKRNDWTKVESDCRRAVELDRESVKGHYMLGLALLQRNEFAEGIKELEKALHLGKGAKPKGIIEDVWQELARAKYLLWEQESSKRSWELQSLKEACESALEEKLALEISRTEEFSDEAADTHLKQIETLKQVFQKAAEDDMPTEVPDYLCCKISLDIFHDPVITPSGVSYERAVILEHLEKVGNFDPITREPLTESQLISNLAIKEAVRAFMDKHGWAYKTGMAGSSNNPWDLRIPESDRFRGCATNLTRIKRVIEAIRWKLTRAQFAELKKSIFGHLLEIDTDFKGMIMHNVLMKRVVQTETDEMSQLWFRIDNKLIRLSIREWCLVTGLCAGDSSVEAQCKTFKIRDRYFGDILYGKISDLNAKFSYFDFTEISDTDVVKIALYYFADRVLFARPDERRVNIKLINAVEDLDFFNNIPWGSLTRDFVRDQVNKVLLGKANKFKEDRNKNKGHLEEKYKFYGFCLGVQAWTFEAIGLMASEYVIKGNCVYPRINRRTVRGAQQILL